MARGRGLTERRSKDMVPAGSPGCDLRTGSLGCSFTCACPQSAASLQLAAAVRPGKGLIRSSASLKTSFVRKEPLGGEALRNVAEIFCPVSEELGALPKEYGLF